MKIIGLNFGEFNSSAALCHKSQIIAGAPEERFIRQKKTKLFPKNALDYCLVQADCKLRDINAIAQAWNPGARWVAYNPLISSTRVKREDYFYSVPDHLYNWVNRREIPNFVLQKIPGEIPDIYYVKHHLCHASNAFFLSNFDEAAFLTADWQGEMECITKGIGRGNKIDVLDSQWMPNSIGMFYTTFTEILGYRPDNDEWKVMAMSAENVDCSLYEEKILATIKLLENGRFTLDQGFYTGALVDQPNLFSEKLLQLIDTSSDNLMKSNSDYAWQCKVAKAMQRVSEKIIWHVLEDLYEKTQAKNLVLSGGFFMNSVINGKVLDNTKFECIYLSHSPDDLGNSIGAALYVNHCVLGQPRTNYEATSNIGPKYSLTDIESALERRKVKYEKLKNPEQEVAKILSRGEVVAVFQGGMEFGDRALGFRSILGDPRAVTMKDKINSMIKYRESYRPFAPATLAAKAHEIFEVDKGYQCNYMEKVVQVRNEWRKKLPAVTHFDGSGRLQTVQKKHNPYFYRIIEEFEKISEIPVVLNTSFNINGEPIVLTPDDALSTFFNSGLEFLMLENFLVKKIS
jgi:carbamoyltransferase